MCLEQYSKVKLDQQLWLDQSLQVVAEGMGRLPWNLILNHLIIQIPHIPFYELYKPLDLLSIMHPKHFESFEQQQQHYCL